MSLLFFIPVIAVLILAHELGHFLSARALGVKVQEFGIGYPPRLFRLPIGGAKIRFKKYEVKWHERTVMTIRWIEIEPGETEYSLNLLPLGGFVRLLGEEDPSHPQSMAGKSLGARCIILSAGSVMNALLPVLLFSLSFIVPKTVEVGQVVVNQVMPGSPAERAGLKAGDIILRVNGRPVKNVGDLQYQVQLNLGREVTLAVREGRLAFREVKVVPRWRTPEGQGPTGIVIGMANAYPERQSYPFWRAFPLGVRSTLETLLLTRNGIITMILQGSAPQMAGPIGIAQITGEVARFGLASLIQFTALLSINLAILNLLPIPGLDGGRLLFVFIEGIRRGKRISPRREGLVHFIGMAVLLALVTAISYFDILRIIRGESLLP